MRKKAFTLTELLVVISVISLLMAVLMPALARARQQGKTVLCLGNLRQMMITALMYTNSNNDYFPMATITEISGSLRKNVYEQ
jgi:prepilin-type N-terminal cleavage/methylation domain-containing protein